MNGTARTVPELPAGTRVLVHGLGRFGGGRETIRHLARRGCRVRVADRGDGPDLRSERDSLQAALHGLLVEWHLGSEAESLLDDIECFVQNPAVPDEHPLVQAAARRGIARTQELDLFLAAYPGRVIGVTGTNGKSTTATMLHRALQRAGFDALLGGNIGHSLLADEAAWRAEQLAVVEMSSFQLERMADSIRVEGAVFTRVTSDHLDRHGSLTNYHAAKSRLARAARGFVVHAAADPVAAAYATTAAVRLRYALTAPAPDSVGLEHGFVTIRRGGRPRRTILHRDALQQPGDFQVENAMAAAAAADCVDAAPDRVGLALATAAPLPFRLQRVRQLDGVTIYDNAVSTAAESTRTALTALTGKHTRIHWVGGGKSKSDDFAAVVTALAPHCASAHVFGHAADPLAASWRGAPARAVTADEAGGTNAPPTPANPPLTTHDDLHNALGAARRAANPGDAILFSPGFASFDQFPNFRARALAFHDWLRSASSRTSG